VRAQERKTLSGMLQEVHKSNKPMFTPSEEASLLKGIGDNYGKLLIKNNLETNPTTTEDSLCLEGGQTATYGHEKSDDPRAINNNIDNIFP
jgi:hypothetical protein